MLECVNIFVINYRQLKVSISAVVRLNVCIKNFQHSVLAERSKESLAERRKRLLKLFFLSFFLSFLELIAAKARIIKI